VKAGMRRARLEGRQIGRVPLAVDRAALLRDLARGVKLTQLAKAYGISKASVCRIIKEAPTTVSQGFLPDASSSTDIKELTPPKTAA
jgi:DNA invertase Pin-like site-specific DNA recombinase